MGLSIAVVGGSISVERPAVGVAGAFYRAKMQGFRGSEFICYGDCTENIVSHGGWTGAGWSGRTWSLC